MADLDPAHVEAVARAIDPVPFDNEANLPAWEFYREGALRHATYLLTSTDPAVHAALLAALVRAGVLEEERESATLRMFGGKVVMRKGTSRFVTEWAEVSDDA